MKLNSRSLLYVMLVVTIYTIYSCTGMPRKPHTGRPEDRNSPPGKAKGHDKENTNAGPKINKGRRYDRVMKDKGLRYLHKYKCVGRGRRRCPEPELDDMEESLMELQRMGGLQQTGILDEPTARLMSMPRCGSNMGDMSNVTDEGERKKRYIVAGSIYKWNVLDLTYKIKNYPNTTISVITTEEVDDAVSTALKFWSDFTPLTFTRVSSTSPADIVLRFGKGTHTGVSGDPPFDGPGGTLAHAFTPNSGWGNLNGDIHYDDDESFTHKKYFGRNLQYVSAHEAGHALGLDHSDVTGSLMWPWIIGYIANYQLPDDDRLGIQAIYGENPNPPTPEPVITTEAYVTTPAPTVPPYCNMTFDDVAILRGEIFVFQRMKFWRFSLDGHLITDIDGSPIRKYFKGVTSTLSGIFERWYDEKIIFIKGQNYYQLDGLTVAEGYPISLTERGVPRSITGVMHRASTGITYFFKSRLVYEYDEYEGDLMPDTPRKSHYVFPGIPRGTIVTAAFTGMDGNGYILSGENYYTVDPNMESDGIVSNFAQDFLRC